MVGLNCIALQLTISKRLAKIYFRGLYAINEIILFAHNSFVNSFLPLRKIRKMHFFFYVLVKLNFKGNV